MTSTMDTLTLTTMDPQSLAFAYRYDTATDAGMGYRPPAGHAAQGALEIEAAQFSVYRREDGSKYAVAERDGEPWAVDMTIDTKLFVAMLGRADVRGTIRSEDAGPVDGVQTGEIYRRVEIPLHGVVHHRLSYEHPAGRPSQATFNEDESVSERWSTPWGDRMIPFMVVDEYGQELDIHELAELILGYTDAGDLDRTVVTQMGDDDLLHELYGDSEGDEAPARCAGPGM